MTFTIRFVSQSQYQASFLIVYSTKIGRDGGDDEEEWQETPLFVIIAGGDCSCLLSLFDRFCFRLNADEDCGFQPKLSHV